MRQVLTHTQPSSFCRRITVALVAGLVCLGRAALGQMAVPLDVTASQAIRNYDSSILPGTNPNAGAHGYTVVSGCRVLIIHAGANNVADPPDLTGNPTGDDTILATTAIGEGIAPDIALSGRFAISIYPPPPDGSRLYARVFNAANPADDTHYGQSALFIVSGVNVFDVSDLGLSATSTALPNGTLQFATAAYNATENSGSVTVTVTRTGGSAGPVSVHYATSNGTATAGSDYTAASGTLNWAGGDTTDKIFTVPVLNDAVYEAHETVNLTLSSPAGGATLGAPSAATLTIQNEDPPTIMISDASVTEGNSGTVNATFTVSLSGPFGQVVTVNYASADNTAGSASDYTAVSGILNFPTNTTTQIITVPVQGDALNEANETFLVNLSSPVNGTFADNQGVGTIVNDDPLPLVSITDATVTEGNSGTVNATFTVTLSAPSGRTVTVSYNTSDVTANAGSDYTSAIGVLTFTPGAVSRTITVAVKGDTVTEPNETFRVNLVMATNATIVDNQGIGTINNDDVTPVLTINDLTMTEGNNPNQKATLQVTLSQASPQSVTVNYATANDTATAGSDYQATVGTLTIPAGALNAVIQIPIIGDTLNEQNERFYLNLTNPQRCTLARTQIACTLQNDDVAPQLSINDISVTEGNSGTTNGVFTVSLSAPSGQAVQVNYATQNGSAFAGSDYVSKSGTLTFPAGTTARTISVVVNGDESVEPNETFTILLTGPVNALLADNQGACTITNDDSAAPEGGAPMAAGGQAPPAASAPATDGGLGGPLAPQLQFSAASYSFAETATNAVIVITRTGDTNGVVSVNYATFDGTATGGLDYSDTNGALLFAPGDVSQRVQVPLLPDAFGEGPESFHLQLLDPAGGALLGVPAIVEITITDDGP